jgi:Zn-dependent protease
VPIFEDRSGFAREVEEELQAMESSAKRPMRSFLLLLASLVFFIGFQLVSTSVSGVLMLIVVLLVHECGHWIAMKLSGYRDVQMFFIPLFGAAVSGAETVPSGTRRAVVALAGPVPGIALGLLCAVLFQSTGQHLLRESARTFLILNTFNLLPFIPLDGGHFMEAVVFSRHPILKAAFSLIAGIALALVAWTAASGVFGVLAFLIFRSIPFTYSSGRLARDLKEELDRQGEAPIGLTSSGGAGRIPAEFIERLIPFLELYIPDAHRTPRGVAAALRNIWNMVWFRPPSVIASVGLLIAYVTCLGLGVVATFGVEMMFRSSGMPR